LSYNILLAFDEASESDAVSKEIEMPPYLSLVTSLKVGGAVASGLGSIVLAWRLTVIAKWIVYCLVAHEQSIEQLRAVASGRDQGTHVISGVPKHLLDIESKFGMTLLVVGFLLLGIGLLCTAASYVLGAC
jgi:hypothetical protein